MTRSHLVAYVAGAESLPALPDSVLAVPAAKGLMVLDGAPVRPGRTRRATAEAALARQRLLETLMQAGPVVPAAPGLAFAAEEVPALVAANRDTLAGAAAQIADRVQFQFVLRWDARTALLRFAAEPELAPLLARGRTTSAELARAVERLTARLAATVLVTLDAICDDIIAHPVPLEGLVHLSLLVARGRLGALDDALGRIDAIWSAGFRIQLIGPAPPVSFALMHVERVAPRCVAEAADRLGLTLPVPADVLAGRRRDLLRAGAEPPDRIARAVAIASAASAVPHGAPVFLVEARREGPRAVVPGVARAA